MAIVIYPSRAFSKPAVRPPSGLREQEAALRVVEKATLFLWSRSSLSSLGAGSVTALQSQMPASGITLKFSGEQDL